MPDNRVPGLQVTEIESSPLSDNFHINITAYIYMPLEDKLITSQESDDDSFFASRMPILNLPALRVVCAYNLPSNEV